MSDQDGAATRTGFANQDGAKFGANVNGKRPHGPSKRSLKKKQKTKRERNMTEGSTEEVLAADVQALLKSLKLSDDEAADEEQLAAALPAEGSEVNVKVLELSSTGDGLAVLHTPDSPAPPHPHVYVVSFVAPGDIVRVKVYRHLLHERHSVADYISVVRPGPLRDDSRIRCPYFSQCSGCQFQMLDYPEQLRHKRTIVEKAFRNFSHLPPELIPVVGDTIGSPLQYGYRTKLTPHFDGPPGYRPSKKNAPKVFFESRPDIGFMQKGKRKVIDIEDCPIGTDAVRKGMARERARMANEYAEYSRGATILLRESTQRYPKDSPEIPETIPSDAVRVDDEKHVDIKTCITDNNATTTEFIDDHIFTNPAGSFFQNNNSILPPFTDYIRQRILPPKSAASIKYLIDAYSGSGLFTISLASLFTSSIGIDIADKSIDFARKNAAHNGMKADSCSFIAADARQLFKSVTYPRDETVVVLDPPRKGCDADFLGQLLRFGPKRVVYVSCNVHTQARDVGALVRGDGGDGVKYEIESLVGFDFFPQTGHVEGVAVLNRVETEEMTAPGTSNEVPKDN
ncbi:hypothetical protein jhhlp_002167 [Lomentospora prolificans]|uniref:tRNA (uracil(54)-C(5))-methyltransferase n=1 Tax=Lomentospora prolificans TaxID=41688 RepID=A0A2N3ND81_9PEZI|nr:hypothetical protein jhhlp_002167 [Lomentospora prolificans]